MDIGRKCATEDGFGTFGSGITRALFQAEGKELVSRE